MKVALFDDPVIRRQLLPFTYTRPVAEIRYGISTITEKWQRRLNTSLLFVTQNYLQQKFKGPAPGDSCILINGAVVPTKELVERIEHLDSGQAITKGDLIIAAKVDSNDNIEVLKTMSATEYAGELTVLQRTWEIFKGAGQQIKKDFIALTAGRKSAGITDPYTRTYNEKDIFIEEGVSIKAAVLDADNGPIYLGKNSSVEAGAIIKGPFGLGEGSTINGLAHMRGDIAIGPYCKVGGEVSNSIIFAYSNKGHDGFLGNSVLGEWCNIGAGTNTSNLKNNYAKVKIWDFAKGGFINTGEQFCGLMMGDHSKSGIGTIFNTGTVTGVAANIFGSGFPRNYIPSFSWGGHAGFTTFRPNKVKEMASASMARRNRKFDEIEESIMQHIFNQTEEFRTWEK